MRREGPHRSLTHPRRLSLSLSSLLSSEQLLRLLLMRRPEAKQSALLSGALATLTRFRCLRNTLGGESRAMTVVMSKNNCGPKTRSHDSCHWCKWKWHRHDIHHGSFMTHPYPGHQLGQVLASSWSISLDSLAFSGRAGIQKHKSRVSTMPARLLAVVRLTATNQSRPPTLPRPLAPAKHRGLQVGYCTHQAINR